MTRYSGIGAFYSEAISKIILIQQQKIILFDPYNCDFELLSVTSPYTASNSDGFITSINDKLYINPSEGSYNNNKMAVLDPITMRITYIDYYPPRESCIIADDDNDDLYILGGQPNISEYDWYRTARIAQLSGSEIDDNALDTFTIYSTNTSTSYLENYLNRTRRQSGCIKYEDTLYVFGGKITYYIVGTLLLYSIESYNLNKDNDWKFYTNIRLSDPNPVVIKFNGLIYLFNYEIDSQTARIQIFDPIYKILTNDTSSNSFLDGTQSIEYEGRYTSRPVNVNDELLFVFGGDDRFTFHIGIDENHNSVLNKLNESCFWVPTVSPTDQPSIPPTYDPTLSPSSNPSLSPTVDAASYAQTPTEVSVVTILIFVIILVLIFFVMCIYVIRRSNSGIKEEQSQAFLWTLRISHTITWCMMLIWIDYYTSIFPNDVTLTLCYRDDRNNIANQVDYNCPTNNALYDDDPSERCSCWVDPRTDSCIIAMDSSKCNGPNGAWTCSCYYSMREPEAYAPLGYVLIGWIIFMQALRLSLALWERHRLNIITSRTNDGKTNNIKVNELIAEISLVGDSIWAIVVYHNLPLGKSILLYMYHRKMFRTIAGVGFFILETIAGLVYIVYYGYRFMDDLYGVEHGGNFGMFWWMILFVIGFYVMIQFLYWCLANQYVDDEDLIYDLKKYTILTAEGRVREIPTSWNGPELKDVPGYNYYEKVDSGREGTTTQPI